MEMKEKGDKNELYNLAPLWFSGLISIPFLVSSIILMHKKYFFFGLLFALGIGSAIKLMKMDKKIKNYSIVLVFINVAILIFANFYNQAYFLWVFLITILWVLICLRIAFKEYYE